MAFYLLLSLLFLSCTLATARTTYEGSLQAVGVQFKAQFSSSPAPKPKPHVFLVLVDDWGWNDVGYHRNVTDNEIDTPNVNNLAAAGIRLERHYTYNYCSPSRSSLQSGRMPNHVSVENTDPISHNPKDPVSGFSGIPRNMTCIAEKLKSAGYRTHMTGKWDAGMATYEHTPMGRGYETFFGYYHHANDYFEQTLSAGSTVHTDLCNQLGHTLVDLWNTKNPAWGINGTMYEEDLFLRNSLKVINEHDASDVNHPLFLFHSFHIVHTPLQVPEVWENRFSSLRNQDRRRYAAMVQFMDHALGKMVAAFQAKGMWDNTLMIVSSDNGGPIYGAFFSPTPPYLKGNFGAANNLPLRGGKLSDWEGGVRVNAFVTGGYLPVKVRGTELHKYIHIADWYATICSAAGVDAYDHKAEAAGLPKVDSINMLPLLMGETTKGPRNEIWLSENTLISGKYKLLTGSDSIIRIPGMPTTRIPYDVHAVGWGVQAIYNALKFGRNCSAGCLFDVQADPNEDHQIKDQPATVAKLMNRLRQLNTGKFSPDRGEPVKYACEVAVTKYKGFYGPFVDVSF